MGESALSSSCSSIYCRHKSGVKGNHHPLRDCNERYFVICSHDRHSSPGIPLVHSFPNERQIVDKFTSYTAGVGEREEGRERGSRIAKVLKDEVRVESPELKAHIASRGTVMLTTAVSRCRSLLQLLLLFPLFVHQYLLKRIARQSQWQLQLVPNLSSRCCADGASLPPFQELKGRREFQSTHPFCPQQLLLPLVSRFTCCCCCSQGERESKSSRERAREKRQEARGRERERARERERSARRGRQVLEQQDDNKTRQEGERLSIKTFVHLHPHSP